MKMIINMNLKNDKQQLLASQKGFSLIELLVAVGIVTITLAGVTASFRNFTHHSSTSIRENTKNAALESTFQLLKRDLNMAGFGLALETRLAEDDRHEPAIESDFTSTYDYNDNDVFTDKLTEILVDYDLDGNGTKEATSLMYRDRLYIANGWAIVEDVTDNGAYDGNIVESPKDYYFAIANKKEEGGFYAKLTTNLTGGEGSLKVVSFNVNKTYKDDEGDDVQTEVNTDDDFKADGALIIYGEDPDKPNEFFLEGKLIASINKLNKPTITFLTDESISNKYNVTSLSSFDTKIVPALCWHVDQKTNDTEPWLYRNQDKVLSGVIGFQTSFGYDVDSDGMQWYQTVPPPSGKLVDGKSETTILLKSLKAVRIVLTVKTGSNNSSGTLTMRTYEKIVLLKN